MFMYMSKKIIFGEKVLGIETASFEDIENITYEVVPRSEFSTLKGKLKNCKSDFKILDDYRVECSPTIRTINLPTETSFFGPGIIDRSGKNSLCDFISHLVRSNALYLGDSEDEESIDETCATSFSKLRPSSSTMTLCISVFNKKDGWKSKNIISPNSIGQLEQHAFYYAISKKEKEYNGSGSIFIRDIEINGEEFRLFKYNKFLPITNSCDTFRLCEPVVCHLAYASYTYRTYIIALEVLKKLIEGNKSIKNDSFEKSESFKSRVNRSGVFISYLDEDSKKRNSEPKDLISFVITEFINLMKVAKNNNKELTDEVIKKFIEVKKLSNLWADLLSVINSFTVIENNEISICTLEGCLYSLEEFNKRYLKTSLFLYNTRVSCVFEPKVLDYKGIVSSFELLGSYYNNKVRIDIR